MADNHADRHRQRSQTEPGPRPAPVELPRHSVIGTALTVSVTEPNLEMSPTEFIHQSRKK